MILLLYLGVNFIKSQNLFSRDNTFYATYDNAAGVESSSPVVIKGFRVGTVENVRYDIKSAQVIVEFSVSDTYPIPANSEAKIASASLMGGKVIELKLGDSPTMMNDGDTIRSLIEPGLMEAVSGEYDKLKAQASTLIEQLSKALFSINAVLSEQNVANLSGTLANLNSATGSIDHLVKTDVSQVVANLNELSVTLKEAGPQITNIVNNVSTMSDSAKLSLPELLTNANRAIVQLEGAIASLNAGEGSAGKLLHDEELYGNLLEASDNLTLLLEDFKANPKRYIHFSVFGGNTKNKAAKAK